MNSYINISGELKLNDEYYVWTFPIDRSTYSTRSPPFTPLLNSTVLFFFNFCEDGKQQLTNSMRCSGNRLFRQEVSCCHLTLNTNETIPTGLKIRHTISLSNREGTVEQTETSKITLFRNPLILITLKKTYYEYTELNIVKCKLEFFSRDSNLILSNSLPYPKYLLQDLKNLYRQGTISDVTIRIGADTLRAHKLILSARSPVFQKMMEHDCIESKSSCITITDSDAKTFDCFLNYLYSDDIKDKSIVAVTALYKLADKYAVEGLRTTCSDIIASEFKTGQVVNCACSVLAMAHQYNDVWLKDIALKFIVGHFDKVGSKPEWKKLLLSDPQLSSEVLVATTVACKGKPI